MESFTSFFTNILLPFVFVFVLTYALMEKAQVLKNKQAHLLVALAMALFFIGVPALINITSVIIPVVSILVVIAFCLLLIFGVFGISLPEANKKYVAPIAILFVIIGIIVVLSIVGVFKNLNISSILRPEVVQIVAFILIAIIVAVIVSRGGGGEAGGKK